MNSMHSATGLPETNVTRIIQNRAADFDRTPVGTLTPPEETAAGAARASAEPVRAHASEARQYNYDIA